MSDPQNFERELHVAELQGALVGTRFGHGVEHFAQAASTNTMLLEAAGKGAPEGTVYVADEQTAGRGREGHGWVSTAGEGLYVSVLVRPTVRLQEALLVSLATGVAAWQAVYAVSGLKADLRWPNDLMIDDLDGTSRKFGGILVESAVESGENPLLKYAVIGVGINLLQEQFPPELEDIATSLRLESGRVVGRGAMLVALLRALDLELTRLESGNEIGHLLARFAERSSWAKGKRVSVPEQGGYTGTTAGLDSRGFLQVDADDGSRRTVISGGVREF